MTAPVLFGCEPLVAEGSNLGVLVLHGFTGSPASMRSLAEGFAARGYTVEMPLLPGHGTDLADMIPTRWADWYGEADAALGRLFTRCERVAVVGLSMGGGLSLALAEQHRDIAALGLVNPMCQPLVAELREGIDALLESGLEYFDSIGSDIAKQDVSELGYPGTPLEAAKSLSFAMETVHADLSNIVAPTLVLTSRQDHVVPPDTAAAIVERVSGPVRQVLLENSYHVATMDFDQALVEAEIFAHIAEHLGANS
jgi:carboxylesterase